MTAPDYEFECPTTFAFAKQLLRDLALDNGGPFECTPEELNLLVDGLNEMGGDGLRFTLENSEELVAGEVGEVFDKFGHMKGFDLVNKTLNEIFERPII